MKEKNVGRAWFFLRIFKNTKLLCKIRLAVLLAREFYSVDL